MKDDYKTSFFFRCTHWSWKTLKIQNILLKFINMGINKRA